MKNDKSNKLNVLRKVIREELRSVIKEELTDILKSGLSSTINEMNQTPKNQIETVNTTTQPKRKKSNLQFKKTAFADILNETDSLSERPQLNEDISMTSGNAESFGYLRKSMDRHYNNTPSVPQVMKDPETGRDLQVDPVVANAITKDYSALMSAINKRKQR